MLRAILIKSWRQHPTKQQLYGYLPLITKTIQVSRTRHAGQSWRSRDELIGDILHMDEQRQDDQLEPTYNSSVAIQDVALKTYRKRWTTENGDGSESVRAAMVTWHDDDNNGVNVMFVIVWISVMYRHLYIDIFSSPRCPSVLAALFSLLG